MKKQYDSKERRRFERVPADVQLSYKVNKPAQMRLKIGDLEKRAGMVDVSEGGLCFASDYEIAIHTELDITFHLILGGGQKALISALGQVRYCLTLPEFKTLPVYRIGVEFTKIDEADKHLIAEYVKTLH